MRPPVQRLPSHLGSPRSPRLTIPGRTIPNCSESSSAPDGSDDGLFSSGKASPMSEVPRSASVFRLDAALLQSRVKNDNAGGITISKSAGATDPVTTTFLQDNIRKSPLLEPSRAQRTVPIAAQIPSQRRTNITPAYTPSPERRSASGDLPGGYFPFHEEKRGVHYPHPLHIDVKGTRAESVRLALHSDPLIAATRAAPAAMPDPPQCLLLSEVNSPEQGQTTTPVTSYIPSGHASPLPMGKYYPSNYEKRKQSHQSQDQPRPTVNPLHFGNVSLKSDSRVPILKTENSVVLSRNESEAKRQLQQYQRDMIAQATLAINNGNIPNAAISVLRDIGFGSMTRPNKPRLAPLGSPGPVTPMELEMKDGDYLDARQVDHGSQSEEVERAIRAEQERRRREGATSPTVELGPSTF